MTRMQAAESRMRAIARRIVKDADPYNIVYLFKYKF